MATDRKTIVQRTRDALGDIGNRMKKNIENPRKAGPTMKSFKTVKPTASTSSMSSENFVAPAMRAPRAANRQENMKKQVIRSNSANPGTGLGTSKSTLNPEIKAKVFTNLQRTHSTQVRPNVDGALKPINKPAASTSIRKIPAKTFRKGSDSSDIEKENSTVVPIAKPSNKPVVETVAAVVPPPVNAAVTSEVKEIEEESITLFEKQVEKPTTTVTESITTTESEVVTEDKVYSSERFEVHDIDAVDEKNPLLVKEYILDICEYLFSLEKKYPIKIRYLEGRLINSRMRAVLLDWLVEVHHQFGFMPETLYMAAKTMDRYLQKERRVTRKQLQLVGVTSMYIAAKFEEVCTPAVLDFAAVSDNAFTATEVRNMEREILHVLEFDLAAPPAVFFLRRFSKAAGAPMMVHAMAKYIMELTVVEYSTCHLFPSEQAASALGLALLIMEKNKTLRELWTPTLEHYTKVPYEGLKRIVSPVASVLVKVHEDTPKLKAVYNKYARNRLSRVSQSPELHLDEWKNRVLTELC